MERPIGVYLPLYNINRERRILIGCVLPAALIGRFCRAAPYARHFRVVGYKIRK